MHISIKILVVSTAVWAASTANLNAITATTSHESSVIVTEASDLDLWIEKLAFQESSGREDIQIIDSNGKWSRGCLQFQDETWKRYSKKFGLTANVLDCIAQKRLAREILLHEKNGWRNWKTSVARIGLPPLPL